MSKYVQYSTVMTDAKCLHKALKSRFKEVELHATKQKLIGYMGDERKNEAEIIIRKRYVGGASNDVGFARNASGSFDAVISDFDHREGSYDEKWLEKLSQDYLKEKAISIMTEQEAELFGDPETLSDGSLVLRFNVPVTA